MAAKSPRLAVRAALKAGRGLIRQRFTDRAAADGAARVISRSHGLATAVDASAIQFWLWHHSDSYGPDGHRCLGRYGSRPIFQDSHAFFRRILSFGTRPAILPFVNNNLQDER